jgi:hypothetical protein
MKIQCKEHGEVEADANYNGDVYCPQCRNALFVEAMQQVPIDPAVAVELRATSNALYEAFKTRFRHEDKPTEMNGVAVKLLHTDKAKPGTQYNSMTIVTREGEVMGSTQSFTPTTEDQEKLLKAGKTYELSEPRGPYSMGCGVRGSMPCELGEPGAPKVKKEPSQYEQFLEDLKKADLIESYKMTGENTAEITMKYAVNWLNKLGWSRINSK